MEIAKTRSNYKKYMKYPVFIPDYGEEEIASVVEVMRRGEISGVFGRAIPDFEAGFAAYIGTAHGVAVSNGTTALQLAVRVAGVQPGDEVIVASCTNIAGGLAVHYNGGIVCPWDSEQTTWNADIDQLEALITPRTKAIIQVHLYGNPMNMERVMQIAEKHGLVVIEDCAEAHGAEWNGRKAGSFGHLACFSFLSNKVITTGEGGMIMTNDDSYAAELRMLRNLAFGERRFLHDVAGYNFRLSALQAGMGLVQLRRLESIVEQKINLFERYAERLRGIPGVILPGIPEEAKHVHWMIGIRIDESNFGCSRDSLISHLRVDEVDTRTFFCPMNQQPFLKCVSPSVPCPVADELWLDGFYLPSTTSLTDSDLDYITESIQKAAGR